MNFSVDVENIKCGGCANSIRTKLLAEGRVSEVVVDIEAGRVVIDGDEGSRDEIVRTLARLGYPEIGSVEGLKAATAKAKSFVSCAVGRLDNAGNKG